MPVELTESAKRKLRDAERQGLLGKGQARKASDAITTRKEANRLALEAARRASGAGSGKRGNQSTDSNQ